jgi:hypothetical protein
VDPRFKQDDLIKYSTERKGYKVLLKEKKRKHTEARDRELIAKSE